MKLVFGIIGLVCCFTALVLLFTHYGLERHSNYSECKMCYNNSEYKPCDCHEVYTYTGKTPVIFWVIWLAGVITTSIYWVLK